MGAVFSGLTKEDISGIKDSGCQFTSKEIARLYKRFKELDKEEIGRVYLDRLLCIPEISINPLGEKVIRTMVQKEGFLDFKGFLSALSIFSKYTTNEEKIKFFIQVISSNNTINRSDLEDISNDLYGGIYSQEDILLGIDRVFKRYSTDQNTLAQNDIRTLNCSILEKIQDERNKRV
ncbi:serine/threonine-protein phosphatase 2B regulatory subunit [Nematocida sp. AWRm80]|nr:serine/threonine-protein phosphatase 2B regulatory subunit [Nematocida sp. AWRm80]